MVWKGNVIDKVDEKIKTLPKKTFLKFQESVLQQRNPLNTLNDIHNQFDVTPVDGVNESFALICQRFYALVPVKEGA